MISVGLIVPTWHYFNDPFKLQPLNELYFATVLDEHYQGKVSVSVIDLRETRRNKPAISADTIDDIIPEKDLYLHWIGKTADFLEVESIIAALRRVYPKALHAAGGVHVHVFPEESKKTFDAIVLGPGEESFKQIIDDLSGCNNIQRQYNSDWSNVLYRNYPMPRRSFLPEESIVNTELFKIYGGVRGSSAMMSRGCNFRCAYCVYNFPHAIQMRTPEQVRDEILYLKGEYKIDGLNLRDEICIPLSPKVAIPYLEAIGSTNVIWRGQTKVGAPKHLFELARQTGCVELAIGAESASQRVLDIINKKQTVDQVRECISICKNLGIRIKMCLIIGLPGESPDILDQTISFIEETSPDFVNVSGFCPMPGSPIFEKKEEYGIKWISSDWSRHAHLMFRFSDEEHFGLPFEYESEGKWGKAFSNERIIENIQHLQAYLRSRGMSY